MSTIQNLNNLGLKAMRQSLGLTVAEASELQGVEVNKRSFQYWEKGEYPISKTSVHEIFSDLATQYHLALHCLTRDIDAYKAKHYPQTDNPEEYFEAIKGKTLILPFFHTFELWQQKTGNHLPHFWKIYQSVIGHLLLIGKLTKLDDTATIPENFRTWDWVNMKYDGEA